MLQRQRQACQQMRASRGFRNRSKRPRSCDDQHEDSCQGQQVDEHAPAVIVSIRKTRFAARSIMSRGADGAATMPRTGASKSNATNRKGYHASKFDVVLQVRSALTCSKASAKANDLDVSIVRHWDELCSFGAVSDH
jgi:hypothetical protein